MMGTRKPCLSSSSTMRGTAAAASSLLTVTRTSSDPARARAAHCCTVEGTSAVSVLVMDCTTIGASEPTRTPPTTTVTVFLRGMIAMEASILPCGIRTWDVGCWSNQALDLDLGAGRRGLQPYASMAHHIENEMEVSMQHHRIKATSLAQKASSVPRAGPPAPQWPSYQGTSQFVGASPSGRLTVYVDPTLGAPGLQNAQDLVNAGDGIANANDAIFGTTGDAVSVIIYAIGGATDGTGGADHGGCDYSTGNAS